MATTTASDATAIRAIVDVLFQKPARPYPDSNVFHMVKDAEVGSADKLINRRLINYVFLMLFYCLSVKGVESQFLNRR